MKITEVVVKLMDKPGDSLKAFCNIVLDNGFIIRDLKVMLGSQGLCVAMPSRMIMVPCPECRGHNPVFAQFCSACGCKLPNRSVTADARGRPELFTEIAFPVNKEFHSLITQKVLQAYETELRKAAPARGRPSQYSGWAAGAESV
ncbi:MAG: septation protein SpoVG family protein [Planctomycetes bacterium]|nr:septation protein SpoVG family protein [Planctomycetota bacterium]